MDSYRSMVKKNWDFRFEKFDDVVKSWKPRILDTLAKRMEVLKVFALGFTMGLQSYLSGRPRSRSLSK